MKVTFYDRIKHTFMPYNTNKYSGLDFFIRAQTAAVCCMALSTVFTYPLDLIHTRTTADFTPANRARIYESTFQCFNRTNIEEGRLGLYKGVEFALFAAMVRAVFQLPVYDMVKWSSNKAGLDNPDGALGTFSQRLGAAFVSGTLLSCLLYPLDTFKRNAQLNGGIGFR